MRGLELRLSRAVGAQASAVAALNILHPLRTQGVRRTLLFATLASAIPVLGNTWWSTPRDVTPPRAALGRGVPVVVALGWYDVGYGTFILMESLPNAS